jgi:cytochrome c biogenesis protein
VWVRLTPDAGGSPGTVNVELGGLARTDNSGWGDEFERLSDRLSPARGRYPRTGLQAAGAAPTASDGDATPPASKRSSEVDVK